MPYPPHRDHGRDQVAGPRSGLCGHRRRVFSAGSNPSRPGEGRRADSERGGGLLVFDLLGRSVLLGDCLDALSCWSSAGARSGLWNRGLGYDLSQHADPAFIASYRRACAGCFAFINVFHRASPAGTGDTTCPDVPSESWRARCDAPAAMHLLQCAWRALSPAGTASRSCLS